MTCGLTMKDMARRYSNRTDLLEDFTELQERVSQTGPRSSMQMPPRTSGGTKKQLTSDEAAEIVAKYEADASTAQLKVEHHMAKRTVATSPATIPMLLEREHYLKWRYVDQALSISRPQSSRLLIIQNHRRAIVTD